MLISDASWCLSIHLMLRKDDLVDGGSGILRSRLQSSVKWSDVSSFETELDTRILSSGWYMIQSNICPCVWVGRFTDCAKLKILSRSSNLDTCWSVGDQKKIEITQDQQTTSNGIAVFQKCRQLFNKQGIGKFILAIRWRSLDRKIWQTFFLMIMMLETIWMNYVQNWMRI